jgi:hypothetical protein
MFDVKGIDDKQLKEFAGKRVQIDGTFSDVNKSATAGPTEDLVDIRGTAIRGRLRRVPTEVTSRRFRRVCGRTAAYLLPTR